MRGAIQRKHDRSVRITGTVSSRTSPLPLRFMVIPDILKHAPRFKRLDARIKGKSGSLGVGRGRAAMRGKAPATGRGTGGRGAVPPVRR
ncbi:BnaC08g19330D [Brassica napus]|uniref:Uncharacterized protein n=2 Tax=Brassica TaxID=3705 RepID=A0A3P6GK79_BRAOL|nr:small nuclear ribonucleoprotein SmD3b isoform X2 [Brassica napus]CAF2109688.1 unnamed protein product [Brassica napus]CDY33633.1 BnaC08g19330D [Brassica napus]VDD56422.1 unnamed protein product [Brassica oleracea]